MLDLLNRLSKLESSLAAALSRSPVKGGPDSAGHLKKVAAQKRKLSRAILSTASRIRGSRKRPPSMPGLRHLSEDVESSLQFLVEAMGKGLGALELAETIALHEYLKWNGLILPVAGPMLEDFPEGITMLACAQRHKKAIERFLDVADARQGLFRIRASQRVWRERFLLVGVPCPQVEERLREDGMVETAKSGQDAIERLSERYYGAVITDEDLHDLKGVELCRKAGRMFPGIEERFLFLYDGVEKKGSPGRKRRLHKSAPGERVIEEVGRILER